MVIPTEFDASFISSTFFPYEYQNGRLRSINNGRCYDWAYYAVRTFNHLPIDLYSTCYHAYIKYQGRYYDSESPDGVEFWQQLGTNNYWGGNPKQQNLNEFMNFWNVTGCGKTRHWDSELEAILFKTLQHRYVPKEQLLLNAGWR